MTSAHPSAASASMSEHQTPPHLIDCSLLRDPAGFDRALRPLLKCVRKLVLAGASAETRAKLSSTDRPRGVRDASWARWMLENGPCASECSARSHLECTDGFVVVGLARRLPYAHHRAALRLWREGVALEHGVPMQLFGEKRDPLPPSSVQERLAELSQHHAQCWWGQAPDGHGGTGAVVAEIFPRPTGFMHAMLVGHRGVGRIVARVPSGQRGTPIFALLASGCTLSTSVPDNADGTRAFPQAWPSLETVVHVPDPDLFALCAAKTWTPSLADAAWLATRDERLALR